MISGPKVLNALKSAEIKLSSAGIDTARLDAEILLSHLLKCGRMALYGRSEEALMPEVVGAFSSLLERRLNREPVAYLTGEQEFWSLSFHVTPDTLIPRPDTETLVEVVLERISNRPAPRILDLGTGSGCILLSLLHEIEEAVGQGVDLSDSALAVAKANARSLGLATRATFLKSDWFAAVNIPDGGFDAIVSNPPYIPSANIEGLMADVRDYEPLSALDGGDDGLSPYRTIASRGVEALLAGGLLAVEVGIHQAADVAALFSAEGLADVRIAKDLAQVDRVVSGKKT